MELKLLTMMEVMALRERSGTVTLDAGVYPITVLFYQGGGGFN